MIYRFDPFSLDTESLELRSGDDVVPVEPQVFSVLTFLIENRDRVVGKDELIDAVWDGRAISDGALNSRINVLPVRRGATIATRTPMMMTTNMSSTKVNPWSLLRILIESSTPNSTC